MNSSIYALNLFDISNAEDYRAYVKASSEEVKKYGGKVIAIGKYREAETGDIKPREVFLLVEWESYEQLQGYMHDPNLNNLHKKRVSGTNNYIWHFFDRTEDFKPLLNRGGR
jgi:uncharacterized protein (DUF1330 family)